MTGPGKRVVPRRWSATLGGIAWLPRMIDKARMKVDGMLGAYLLGHSPIDGALLLRLGLTTAQFENIVARSADDAGVLDTLREHGFDEERVRRWSESVFKRYRLIIYLLDRDDGYVAPNAVERGVLALWRWVERPAMALVRKVSAKP